MHSTAPDVRHRRRPDPPPDRPTGRLHDSSAPLQATVPGIHEQADVIVVGAGPVGMLTAAILAQQGIRVQIIEADRPAWAHSRATVVWPRVLELLHQIGVADELIARGHRLAGVDYIASGRRSASVRVTSLTDTPFPFAVALRQVETEAVLRSALESFGVQIRKTTELRALETSADAVVAHVDTLDGPASVTARWVVGADGAHSTVRKLTGAGFGGEQLRVAFAITDAEIGGEVARDVMSYYYNARGSLAVAPLTEKVARIAVSVPFDTEVVEPGREFFQTVVGERVPQRCEVGELAFSAVFRVHARNADRFRYGRALLVGDAAHVMSPAGAQGMNTGLQDAAALAWRLAMVVRGEAAEDLLDDYDRERRRAARDVVAATSLQTRWGVATGARVPMRTIGLQAARHSGLFQRALAPVVAQTGTTYSSDRPAGTASLLTAGRRRVGPGDRLPALPTYPDAATPPAATPAADAGSPWPTVDSSRFTVVAFVRGNGPRGDVVSSQLAALAASHRAAYAVGDARRQLPRLWRMRSCAVIARPDGHIHRVIRIDGTDDWHDRLDAELAALRRPPRAGRSAA